MNVHRFAWMLSVALVAALPLVCTPEAAAQFVVEDPSAIAQLAQQITQGLQQIKTTQQQLEQLRNAARQLDPRSYQTVQALLGGGDVNYASLTRDVSTIGYTLDRVNTQFARVFPSEDSVRAMKPADHESTAVQMRDEVYNAGLVSARAQTTLGDIEQNNVEAQAVLSRSAGTDSQVAQLQSALQMLALIHQNLVSITMAVNAAGRVSSDIAAQAVVERRIETERRRRLFEDYSRHEDIPEIDPRVFEERSK